MLYLDQSRRNHLERAREPVCGETTEKGRRYRLSCKHRVFCGLQLRFIGDRRNRRSIDAWSRPGDDEAVRVAIAIALRGYCEVHADGFTEDLDKLRSKVAKYYAKWVSNALCVANEETGPSDTEADGG